MDIRGITWQGESIDDVEILRDLPAELVRLLSDINGFILHEGAVQCWTQSHDAARGADG